MLMVPSPVQRWSAAWKSWPVRQDLPIGHRSGKPCRADRRQVATTFIPLDFAQGIVPLLLAKGNPAMLCSANRPGTCVAYSEAFGERLACTGRYGQR